VGSPKGSPLGPKRGLHAEPGTSIL
jgi:hypothetical protein